MRFARHRAGNADTVKRKLKTELPRGSAAEPRRMHRIPIVGADGTPVRLGKSVSPLIRIAVREFCSRWTPGGRLVHFEDGGGSQTSSDETLMKEFGASIKTQGRMPDLVVYFEEKNRLVLVEAVTSHGPVDGKRHEELAKLFAGSKAGLVYVTAFPNRSIMSRYLGEIAWETEVWVANAPSPLVHFNGERFLGQYPHGRLIAVVVKPEVDQPT